MFLFILFIFFSVKDKQIIFLFKKKERRRFQWYDEILKIEYHYINFITVLIIVNIISRLFVLSVFYAIELIIAIVISL